ncbi:MAG: hypothetical protein HQM16_04860 [Deltaproteobacteria bacterium]|nr:hypothetical protein [Deltaproteobacteria bacterium]
MNLKKGLVVLFVMLLASSCAVVDAMDYKGYVYSPRDKSFEVSFDAKPIVTTTNQGAYVSDPLKFPWGKLHMNVVLYPSRFTVEALYYADLPKEALAMDSAAFFEQLKTARVAMLKETESHFKLKDLKFTNIAGYPAMTARAVLIPADKAAADYDKGPKKFCAVYRAILANKRLYEIVVVNRDEMPSGAMIELFMDTFKVLKK